jgi:hypothetical protein
MITTRATMCVDPETLAAFAEGKLDQAQARAIMVHLDQCAACSEVVEAVAGHADAQPVRRWSGRWIALAAAMLVLIAGPLLWQRLRTPALPMRQLASLAPRDARSLEARIGEIPYARFSGRMRAGDDGENPRRMKLVGIAGDLLAEADRTRAAQTQHDAGVALLLIDRPESAVVRLRAAAEAAPEQAMRWNDLAAAQYALAEKSARPSLYPEALAACDRALDADPRLPEALFNRALVLERLGLRQEARAAWEQFLAADSSSPWSAEARRHLSQLPGSTGESLFKRDQPRLEQVAAANDTAGLEVLVRRYPQRSRTFGESEYLGRWAEAILADDPARAARELTVARGIGAALARISGELLLRDAVRAIDEADGSSQRRLAEAHLLYRKGRIALSRQEPAAAESDLLQAAERFGTHPMALLARYYAANARYDRNDPAGARQALEQLLQAADTQPHFRAIGAQIRHQLAVCAIADVDWRRAASFATEAESRFRALGERSNQGFAAAVAASALLSAGRLEDSWGARAAAFALLDEERNGDRLAVGLGEATRTELGAGRLYEARALLRLQMAVGQIGGNDALLGYALISSAVLDSRLQNDRAAHALVGEAKEVARRMPDPSMRERALADAQFAEGAVTLRSDPRLAEQSLSAALAHYGTTARWLFVPESLLLRARARLQLGRGSDAEADLEQGIAVLERYRNDRAGTIAGTGALRVADALFEEAIQLRAARHDVEAVFTYGERRRAQFAPEMAALLPRLRQFQESLNGSGAMVLDLIALPAEIVSLSIDAGDATLTRTPIARGVLEPLAASAAKGDAASSRRLFDLLVRPAIPALSRAGTLIVIADPALRGVPYAALFDAQQGSYLIERAPVALAVSAASLDLAASSERPSTVATLEVESGGAGELPASREETASVRQLYRRAIEVTPSIAGIAEAAARADIFHVAGHTQREPRTDEAVLLLPDGPMSGRAIAEMRLRQPLVVVLAACETLRAPHSTAFEAARGLADGWIAAGAAGVIGTLTPVGDEDARVMFGAIHEELARGATPAAALRRMQLDCIAKERTGTRRVAWQALALLTRTIPRSTT